MHIDRFPEERMPNLRTLVSVVQRVRYYGSFRFHLQDIERGQTRRVRTAGGRKLN